MDRDVKQNIAENVPIENPPEGGAGRDPLQDLSPEARTFEVFQQLNSKTGTLRVQAYAGQRTFPVPGASVLVTHDFADGTRRFSATFCCPRRITPWRSRRRARCRMRFTTYA